MVLGEWMSPNFSHCDWQQSCDLLHHAKTLALNSSTPSTSPSWSLFQSQLRLLVLLQHQSLRHDGRPLPCHHKAFAVHVLHDERNCMCDDYYGLEWPISTLLFAFHLHLQSQSDIYHVRGNIPSAHFPDSAPRYLCRCDFSSPSHCLESQPPHQGTDCSSPPFL